MNAAEGVRDVFGQILAVVDKSSDTIDLHHVLSYSITEVPLSFDIVMAFLSRRTRQFSQKPLKANKKLFL